MKQILRNTCIILIIFCTAGNTFGQRHTGSISGFVRDASNGEPLGYVSIVIENTQMGASSNSKGYYVISRVPAGNYTIFASMIGFKKNTQTVSIATGQSLILDFEIEMDVIEMEKVVVTGERERFESKVEVSSITLRRRELQLSPSLIEPDLFRTLHLMPGVVAKGDFSSELYVRGGSPDQNLILLDGITVYNPFHLGGIFSTFSVDAIKEAELIAGGFPAEYGGRMSSVLDVTLLEGNSKEYEGNGSVSLLTSKMTVQGPIPKGSFLLSGRRTYFDKVYELYQKQRGKDGRFPYYFYDLQGKLNLDLADKHKLTLSGFFGNDVLKFDFNETSEDDSSGSIAGDIDWQWGNSTTSAKWTYLISPRLFSEVLLARSEFNFDIDIEFEFTDEEGEVSDINYRVLDNINDVTLKQNITYFATSEHTIKFGHELKRLLFDVNLQIEDIDIDLLGDSTYTYSIFGQDKWKISDELFVQPGARATYYSEGERYRFEPRLGTKWRVKPDLAIKAAWGYYYQFLTTVNSEDENFRLIEFWYPIDETLEPSRAIHYIAGIEQWLQADLKFTFEGYFKEFKHLHDFNQTEEKFYSGTGTARGIEMLLKKTGGRFTGWVGYTLAKTSRNINGIKYYPRYDKRHNFNAVGSYVTKGNWTYSFSFTFGSGLPFTPVIGKYKRYSDTSSIRYDDDDNYLEEYTITNLDGPKNAALFPTYHRLDMGAKRKYNVMGLNFTMFYQIVNVYNRKNVFMYIWNHETEISQREAVGMFPFFPTLGIDFEF